ncbi:hypothetical protein KBC55_04075 [Patescibacteria group bacterium]|nr:hypothetical protein [Patescibacteria group bacterium]
MPNLITVGEVLDVTISHYKKHAKELLGISLFIVLATIPSAIAEVISPPLSDTSWSALAVITIILQVIGLVATLIASLWITITLILAIQKQDAENKAIDPIALGKESWKYIIQVAIATVITLVITLITTLLWTPGFVLIILSAFETIPSIFGAIGTALFFLGALASVVATLYASVTLGFSNYFIVLNKKNAVAGLKSSYALVKNRFFATLLRSTLPKFIFGIAIFAVTFLMLMAATIMSIALATSAPLLLIGSGVWTLLTVAVSALFIPLPVIIDYYVYDSLSKNK